MGLDMNFKGMATEGNDGRLPSGTGNFSLVRQPSIYSLTFEEFQSTLGGFGKDFGSMNMDEFLKNIWTAEENQATVSAAFGTSEGGPAAGGLQRQGSLTLPRTLSQKTVDEVWRDLSRENGGKDGDGISGANLQQRQQTLGEMTLEEFLVRAGVVREDVHPLLRPDSSGFFGELQRSNNNLGVVLGLSDQSNGIVANRVAENNSQISNQSPNLLVNVSAIRASHQQRQAETQQHLFPTQATMDYSTSMQLESNVEAANAGVKNGTVGIGDPAVSSGFIQSSGGGPLPGTRGGLGMVGVGAGAVTVAMESPKQLSLDGLVKSNGDTSSVSPVPYVFDGGIRGRRSGAIEKVVERRQRRMIKNRESAARSRARKQAYTMELEAEVAKLKEENKELLRTQGEIMEMQKNKVLEMINQQPGPKKRCLTRTLTGPW